MDVCAGLAGADGGRDTICVEIRDREVPILGRQRVRIRTAAAISGHRLVATGVEQSRIVVWWDIYYWRCLLFSYFYDSKLHYFHLLLTLPIYILLVL